MDVHAPTGWCRPAVVPCVNNSLRALSTSHWLCCRDGNHWNTLVVGKEVSHLLQVPFDTACVDEPVTLQSSVALTVLDLPVLPHLPNTAAIHWSVMLS